MPGDDLAAELLTAVLDADPLSGSLYGFPGYDALLPDFSTSTEAEHTPDDGLAETELQTLDFVRCMARSMADAASVPLIEFTISDTFASPVGNVLTSLAKVPLDTDAHREGYL